ncbi:DEAD/DEAH box helicase [Candidatus Dojkabacteria bacterium]|nr:DEAD/DEAH box helicase [Candidatus Dojkabacteria bacterium]
MYQRAYNHRGSGVYGRNRSSYGRRPKRRQSGESKIDIARFINRASPVTTEKYIAQHKFDDFNISETLKVNIKKKNFEEPMPIQDQSIPYLLEGKDLIGIANTGMGKTLAFLIPLINKIINNKSEKVLIIAPTRELALQIDSELKGLTTQLGIFSAICIGGTSIWKQLSNLRRNCNFVIGTPGRLVDLINRGAINLTTFRSIVLDEVDRMLDMGFSKDIKFLIGSLPKQRQSLFFSATVDEKIKTLIREHSNQPVTVSVKTRDTAENVDQDIVRVLDKSKKLDTLRELLIRKDFTRTLIFGQTKHGVQRLMVELNKGGLRAECIHGNKSQSQRQRALSLFKEGKIDILVATDVAARGLDIPQVSHVINYELPKTYEDYVHRIGRTGRANNTGKALTFV